MEHRIFKNVTSRQSLTSKKQCIFICILVGDLFNILQTIHHFKLIFTRNNKHKLLYKKESNIFYSDVIKTT